MEEVESETLAIVDFSQDAKLFSVDLKNIKNIEFQARKQVVERLDNLERRLLEIAAQRRDFFTVRNFKYGDQDYPLLQIQPFVYFRIKGKTSAFYATKAPLNSPDLFDFSSLTPFAEVPEVREKMLRDPEFISAVLGMTLV